MKELNPNKAIQLQALCTLLLEATDYRTFNWAFNYIMKCASQYGEGQEESTFYFFYQLFKRLETTHIEGVLHVFLPTTNYDEMMALLN